MHTEEIKLWIVGKLPEPLVRKLRRTFVRNIFNFVFNLYDNVRFKLLHDKSSGSDELEQEESKLLYSWKTFSKDYLQHRHGQDAEHPSRIRMREIVGELVKHYDRKDRIPRLLEIPFGMGTDYEYTFSKMPVEYTGMELNPKQVKVTRERLPGGNFVVGNIFNLEISDRYFDLVYCRHIFEHLSLKALHTAIKETCRVAGKDLIYVFFKMSNIPDHIDNPVRQYHVNLLSQEKLRGFILSLDIVDDVKVIPVEGYKNWRDNTIFHVTIKPLSQNKSN